VGQGVETARVEETAVQGSGTRYDWALRSLCAELAAAQEEAHAWSCRWSED